MIVSGLGSYVRERRVALGLTQKELAQKVGMPIPYLSLIETGHRSWPKTYVKQMADALGVSEIQLAQEAGLISRQPEGKDGK